MGLKNAKAKGNRQERRAKRDLEEHGWLVVKAGGSLGAFDLIAVNEQGIKAVQVKSNIWPPPAEREAMREAAKKLPPHTQVECWRYNDRQTEPLVRSVYDFEPLGKDV